MQSNENGWVVVAGLHGDIILVLLKEDTDWRKDI